MNNYLYIIAFFSSLVIAFLMTPLARKLAIKVGALDVPKCERKIHKKPMPYFGGLAMYIAIIACAIVFLPHNTVNISVIIGATILVLAGIVDDMYDMPAKVKLLIQIIAAVVAVVGGVRIHFITNPLSMTGMSMLDKFSIPITIIWIVGITNTINLIDGLDGLAAGVSGIASLSLLVTAITKGHDFITVQCAIVSGACFGFLPHNFNPAKIFMGDTGAMLLGYLLSIIGILGMVKSATAITLIVPILAIGIPILDTFFAIIRRLINKKSIMEADKEHLHHQLMNKGLSQKKTVLILYVISAVLGFTAVFISNVSTPIGILAGVIVALVIFLLAKKLNLMRKIK
ncbi:undecaprenyl/decaprenyl-phosphate alpha-N-acetylglucosaminyl 1-phosphate transferase [Sedimentibacter sp. zth1]|uniref:glycosyltransferase family 4 protein n=1 Tax=Sedimentibacter sp. zth1 TaxID=2816908 RepID=UPI001A92F28E|nr:MraY family glycosyltransferase [Sedimentibacter sp. zth1]QSX05051.1 undecaprenyl/decaprenyl-phosphate alpha-N-acetylglucosaminyl 1-phosphate transferase [Sedimentibacter sp. zth1]